jgi:outer membrane biosynthesis protein TonB
VKGKEKKMDKEKKDREKREEKERKEREKREEKERKEKEKRDKKELKKNKNNSSSNNNNGKNVTTTSTARTITISLDSKVSYPSLSHPGFTAAAVGQRSKGVRAFSLYQRTNCTQWWSRVRTRELRRSSSSTRAWASCS